MVQRTSVRSRADAQVVPGKTLQGFLTDVFWAMAFGLAITAIVTLVISQSDTMMSSLYHLREQVGADGKVTILTEISWWWITAAIIELGLVIVLSWTGVAGTMTAGVGISLFAFYAALNGFTMAPVIFAYTMTSVTKVFFITTIMFGGCAIWGHTTKTDLTGLGSFFLMALVGLIVALVVNAFFRSPIMDYLVSIAAVLLFAGLTAYDMQKLRAMYEEQGGYTIGLVVYGALTLYLDFINMFLHLLRLFGSKKS